jgi:hypothetical protein
VLRSQPLDFVGRYTARPRRKGKPQALTKLLAFLVSHYCLLISAALATTGCDPCHDQPHFLASTTINITAAMNVTAAIPLMMLANGSVIPIPALYFCILLQQFSGVNEKPLIYIRLCL